MRALAILIFLITGFAVVGLLSEQFHGDTGLVLRMTIDALLALAPARAPRCSVPERWRESALLSAGMGIANLVPFGGSDGHHILQALHAGGRNRPVR